MDLWATLPGFTLDDQPRGLRAPELLQALLRILF